MGSVHAYDRLRRAWREWSSNSALTGYRMAYLGLFGHLLVGVVHLVDNVQHFHDPRYYLFESAVLLGAPLCLFALLQVVERFDPRDDDYWRLVLWAVGGTTAALLITGLYVLDLHFQRVTIGHVGFRVALAADVGALFGVTAGVQEARVRKSVRRAQRAETRARLSESHRQSLTFLNRILRHHVLNGLSVVLGVTETLRADARGDQTAELDTIRQRGEEIVDYVGDIQTTVTVLSNDIVPTDTDLSEVLTGACSTARRAHPKADIDASIPDGERVRGTGFLRPAFEHLIENAIVHSDAETPRVRIAAEDVDGAVRVTVADNGPGMSDEAKVAYFEHGGHGEKSLGEGLGLYFTEAVVSACDGRIWIEDNEPRGTRVRIDLPAPAS